MYVDVTDDPRRFLDEGSDFLLSDPVVNSVLLSNATNLAERPDPDAEPAVWALIREGDAPAERADPASGSDASAAPAAAAPAAGAGAGAAGAGAGAAGAGAAAASAGAAAAGGTTADGIQQAATGAVSGGAVLGAAMRTPPRGIVISRLPAGGAAALAEALLPSCAQAPTVAGPAPDVEEFAQLWSGRTGESLQVGMEQRIYRLDRVFPVTGVPGKARPARPDDLDVLVDWSLEFYQEIGEPGAAPPTAERARTANERRVEQGLAHIWEDDGPVSFVGSSQPIGGIVRIGPVYTPPEYRARGYASALTAAVSRQALRDGADACALYTDLANPTSNQIYAAIGYRPLCDATTYLVRPSG